ncbi:helix-turn-helix domain-containing protein [Candidatus Woesearchaeota archaeon]|nr:helix-turn-helix domain-containing protein [Candidatus Woesearchaeota archaeon]
MEKFVLMKAGLTENESEVYLALLKRGQSLAGELANETTVSRPHVYDSLNKLIEKGLASYVIKDNRKFFKAANPKELIKFLEEEKDKINEKQKEIEGFLPSLLKLQKTKMPKSSVEFYEGKEGLKTVLMDIINVGKDFVAFGATHRFEKVLPVFSKIFVKKRERKNIKARILVVEGENPIKTSLNEYRWIPKEYSLPSATIAYGDNTAILLYSDEPFGIIIKNREIAESYRHYFELLWRTKK